MERETARLGKVLEDFEDGENVHIDKGVHDGRRAEEVPTLSLDNDTHPANTS